MRRLWILFLVAMLLAACSSPTAPTSAPAKVEPTTAPAKAEPTTAPAETKGGRISVAGSTTVQPLAEKLAEAYFAKNPGVEIDVQGGGSSVGVKSAGQGTTEIGMASRKVKDSELAEYKDMKVYAIAYDGIAIAVNPDVAVEGLTKDQVKGIFGGEIESWKDVGGPDKPIVVVAREEGSGTRAAFEELVMGKEGPAILDRAILQPSNGAVRTTVSSTPDSVGFLSFGYLDNTVKALKVDGAAPTAANAMNGSYPVVRPLNMMTLGEPAGAAKSWFDFIMSDAGQAIVADEGYIAVN